MDKENQEEEVTIFWLLVKRLKKPVAVLVDEYNTVFDSKSERTREYFFNFFQSLKDLKATDQLGFAFITGCDKVKMNIEGYTSNHWLGITLGITDISDALEYANLLGFTKDEIVKSYHLLVKRKAKACNKDDDMIYE